MMFAPFESVTLGIASLSIALAVLRIGAWAIRSSMASASDEGTFGE